LRRLHPATIIVAILPKLREAIQTAIPFFIGSLYSHHESNQEWVAILIAALTGFFSISVFLTTRFDVEGNHVMHRTGWIFRKDRRIPLDQIQNVSLRQNLLERFLKVATVDVETALGRGRDLKLSVLRLADAERFREELLTAAHLSETPQTSTDSPAIRLNRHDLLLGAVTENHIGQMIFGTLFAWGPLFGTARRLTRGMSLDVRLVILSGVAVLALAIGWAWGAIAYYLKYGDFTVRRDENAFRISYGITNRSQVVIRPRRIEYLSLTATFIQRLLDRASLSVGTASTFGESGRFAPVALFVERRRAYAAAAEVIPGLDLSSVPWRPFEPIFYRVRAFRAVFLFVVFGLAAFGTSRLDLDAMEVVTALLGLIALAQIFNTIGLFVTRSQNGFGITDDALLTRRGFLTQTISAIPIHRIENAAVTQPVWWKKYRAANLTVQAMRQKLTVGGIPEAAIEELTTLWKSKIEAEGAIPVEPLPDPVSFPATQEPLLQ